MIKKEKRLSILKELVDPNQTYKRRNHIKKPQSMTAAFSCVVVCINTIVQ